MKSKKALVFLLIVFLAAGMGVLIKKGAVSGWTKEISKQVAKYHCPMHPNIVSDKPGDCPVCHMRLVPIENAAVPSDIVISSGSSKDPNEICIMHNCPMCKKGQPCPA